MKRLKEIRKEFETELFIPGDKEGMNVELDKAIRLNDFITMGELIAYDALNRNESCGGHFREEYQTEAAATSARNTRRKKAKPSATTRTTSTWLAGSTRAATTRHPYC